MNNPKLALDAVLEADSSKSQLKPMTLARWALLELLESPFTGSGKPFTAIELIPSLYVMTHGIEDLKGYSSKNIDELRAAAMEEAEDMQLEDVKKLSDGIVDSINKLFKLAPQASDDANTKKK